MNLTRFCFYPYQFFFLFFCHLIGWKQDDEKFLTEVFAQLTDEATDDSKRRELVSKALSKYLNLILQYNGDA